MRTTPKCGGASRRASLATRWRGCSNARRRCEVALIFVSAHEKASAAPSIGIDLGGTKIEALLLTANGEARWRERVATPQGDYRATLDAVAALIARAERDTGVTGARVGIGTPGSATRAGLIRNANSTCLNGQPLQRDLEALLARPLRLANDANCLALSEATDGAGAGAEVVFAVILGTGVGGGLVVRGKLLAGANGLAGEWGHNPLPWPLPDEVGDAHAATCYCGKAGCIETWLSGPGLTRDHVRHGGEALSAEQIAQRAAGGEAACEASLRRYESRLARALAAVINLVDPDVIVLGGGLSLIDRLYTSVPALWARHVFSAGAPPALCTRLVKSAHGDASGVRGAAWLWGVPQRRH
jgi:fructokinase